MRKEMCMVVYANMKMRLQVKAKVKMRETI